MPLARVGNQLYRVPDGATESQIVEAIGRYRAQNPSESSDSVAQGGPTLDTAGLPSPRPEQSEFAKGVSVGVDSLQGSLYGLAALVGDTVGSEELKQFGLENYQRNVEEQQRTGLKVTGLDQIEDIGSFFDYASGALGQAVPSLASTAAGGGVGGIVGKAVAKRAVANLVERGVKKEIAETAVGSALKDEAKRRTIMAAVKRGALSGAFVASAGQQQGALYTDLKEAGVEDAVLPAWAFGAAQGALDIVGEVALAKKLLPGQVEKELEKSLIRGLAKGTAKQAALEGATEGAQSAIGSFARILNREDDSFTSKDVDELLNNAAAGAIVGAVLGAPASLIEQSRAKQPKKEPTNANQQRSERTRPAPAKRPATGATSGNTLRGTGTGVPAQPATQADVGRPAPVSDAPSAEPLGDILVQFRDTQDPANPRKATYLSAANLVKHGNLRAPHGLVRIDDADGKGGALFIKPNARAEFARRLAAGEPREAIIGSLTLSGTGKQPGANAVVQQKDADGAVTAESVVTPDQIQNVARRFLQPGRTVEVTTPEGALQRREQVIAQEERAVARDDLSIAGSDEQASLVEQLSNVLPDNDVGHAALKWVVDNNQFQNVGGARGRFGSRVIAARAIERAFGLVDADPSTLTDEQLEAQAEAARLRREQRGFDQEAGTESAVETVDENLVDEGAIEDATRGGEENEFTEQDDNERLERTDSTKPFTYIGLGRRRHGEKQIVDKKQQTIVARPIANTENETAEVRAHRFAREQQSVDQDAIYVAREVNEKEAQAAGLAGPGWYVSAYRVPAADTTFSPTVGGTATQTQAVQTFVQRAKSRWNRLSLEQKNPRANEPVLGFKLAVLDKDGKPVLTDKGNPLEQGFAAEDIVDLGHVLNDTAGQRDARSVLNAFYEGLSAITGFIEPNGRRYVVTDAPTKQYNLVLRDFNKQTGQAGALLGETIISASAVSQSTATTDGFGGLVNTIGSSESDPQAADNTASYRQESFLVENRRPEHKDKVGPARPKRVNSYRREKRSYQERDTVGPSRNYERLSSYVEIPESNQRPVDEETPVFDRADPNFGDVDTADRVDARGYESEQDANARSVGARNTTELGVSRPGRAGAEYHINPPRGPFTEGIKPTSVARETGDETPAVRVRMTDPDTARRFAGMAREIRRILKLRKNLVISNDRDRFVRMLQEAGLPTYADEAAAKIDNPGRSAAFVISGAGGDTAYIFLMPHASEAQLIKSLAHEIGHVFFDQYWGDTSNETRKALIDAFETFLEDNPNFRKGLPYAQRMEEWIADNVAAWVATNKEPRTAVEKWFKDLGEFISRVWAFIAGNFPVDLTVQQFINETITTQETKLDPAFDSLGAANSRFRDDEATLSEPPSRLRELWTKARAIKAKYPKLGGMLDFVHDSAIAMHNGLTSSLQARIRRMNIAAFNEVIAQFHHRPGDAGGFTFDTEVANRIQNFAQQYDAIIAGVKNKAGFLEAIRTEKVIDDLPAEFREAAKEMRKLLRRLYEYQVEAGLPISEVPNYFPQVGDIEELLKPDAVDTIFRAIQNAGVQWNTDHGFIPITREMVQGWVENLSDDTYSVNFDPARLEDVESNVRTPFVQALRSRVLQPQVREVIRNIKDERGQSRFYAKSLDEIMHRYVRQAVRRAEYNRRFGEDVRAIPPAENGAEPRKWNPHGKFQQLMDRARREGAEQWQQELMYDAMSAFMGNYGRIRSEPLKKLSKSVAFYQNLRTLLWVTVSSFPEIATLFLRTGNFGQTWRVMRASAAEAWRKGGDTSKLLRAYGFAVDELDALSFKEFYDARDYNSKINRLNESWFRAIGLTRWTNFMRGLSLNVSIDYMKEHARRVADGLDTTGDSKRRLDELGVSVEDMAAWAAAGEPVYGQVGATLEDQRAGRSQFTPEQLDSIKRVTGAVTRMINEIVINPNAAVKPLWRSDERWSLVSQLGSFTYGFLEVVLKRVWYELNRTGAPTMARAAPLIALAMMLPLAALGIELKELFQYRIWGKEARTDGMSGPEYIRTLISRTGVLGVAQLGVDAYESASYGRDPIGVLLGPTVSQVNSAFRDIAKAKDTSRAVVKTTLGAIPFLSSTPGARDLLTPEPER